MNVPDRQTTRRQALGLGAAAFAAGALRAPASALARPALFELDLGGELAAARRRRRGWRTTRVLRAPRRFDLVGLRWARGSARRGAGPRAPARRQWTRVGARCTPTGDHGPDGGRAAGAAPTPRSSAPPTSSSCACAATRARLRARFVRALPTATVARRVGERLRRRAPRVARRRQAGGPSVRVITRSEWGGDSVPRAPTPTTATSQARVRPPHGRRRTTTRRRTRPGSCSASPATTATPTAGTTSATTSSSTSTARSSRAAPAGSTRRSSAPRRRATTAISTGVACLGTFTEIAQTEAGMDALARLIGWKLSLHGVPVQGRSRSPRPAARATATRSGTPVTLERISGHRDGDSTSCPGDVLYGQLADLRDARRALRRRRSRR